ncbi:hypothetical protein SK128_008343 [Halocaridina rubra]|uniref:Uncharacterized protein n=1 Tax=Halocaridina rubra TaxID=373956 RepID=A0AAN9A9V4_HALRR
MIGESARIVPLLRQVLLHAISECIYGRGASQANWAKIRTKLRTIGSTEPLMQQENSQESKNLIAESCSKRPRSKPGERDMTANGLPH